MKIKSILIVLTILTLMACEKEASISYSIKNSSSSAIKVIYINTKGNSSEQTETIPADNETEIAINEQGLNSVDKYKEKDELLRDFTKMDIYKNI